MTTNGRLSVHLGSEIVQVVDLRVPVTTIGRLPDNTVVLPGVQVAGHHAELRREENGPVLVDVGSAFGTLLDGVRVPAHQPQILRVGSAIQIGLYLLIYLSGEFEGHQHDPKEAQLPSDGGPPHRETTSATQALRLERGPRPLLTGPPLDRDWRGGYLDYLPLI